MKSNAQQLLFADEPGSAQPTHRHERLTFKANRSLGRHGWLRLTPAYSRHLVETLVAPLGRRDRVLDPFCGTGTTALTCAEKGIRCDTVDINPFLVWLADAKFAAYSPDQLEEARAFTARLRLGHERNGFWRPPLKDIEKWWHERDLSALSALFAQIKDAAVSAAARNLLFSAFCRVAIETASVSFGHQSMSFKARPSDHGIVDLHELSNLKGHFGKRLHEVLAAAETPLDGRLARALLGDSRKLPEVLDAKYSCVITSPPYPNRMSYIRELRPYMYWLGYLTDGRQAGELDWQAIGGTWGCATSNLTRWRADPAITIPSLSGSSLSASDGERAGVRCASGPREPRSSRREEAHSKPAGDQSLLTSAATAQGDGSARGRDFPSMLARIAQRSPILSTYVHKYFEDCVLHFRSLTKVLRPGAVVHYIVGNSKFYDEMVHTELLYAAIMRQHGFTGVTVENIRKRSSKKELFEFVVSGKYANVRD